MTPLLQTLSHCSLSLSLSPVVLPRTCAPSCARKRAAGREQATSSPLQLSRSSFTNLGLLAAILLHRSPPFFLDPSPPSIRFHLGYSPLFHPPPPLSLSFFSNIAFPTDRRFAASRSSLSLRRQIDFNFFPDFSTLFFQANKGGEERISESFKDRGSYRFGAEIEGSARVPARN